MSSWLLSISADEASTMSQGNLLHCLTITTVKYLFLMFKLNILYFSVCLFSLVLSLAPVYPCLYWGTHNWKLHCKCVSPVLSREEGSTPSTCWRHCCPLAFFVTRAYCFLMCNLLCTRTPRSLFAKRLSSCLTPVQIMLMCGIFPPQLQHLALPFVKIHEVPVSLSL